MTLSTTSSWNLFPMTWTARGSPTDSLQPSNSIWPYWKTNFIIHSYYLHSIECWENFVIDYLPTGWKLFYHLILILVCNFCDRQDSCWKIEKVPCSVDGIHLARKFAYEALQFNPNLTKNTVDIQFKTDDNFLPYQVLGWLILGPEWHQFLPCSFLPNIRDKTHYIPAFSSSSWGLSCKELWI